MGPPGADVNVWFAPVYVLLGATHVKPEPTEGAGLHDYVFDIDLAAAKKGVPDAVRPAFLRAYRQIPGGKGTRAHGSATIDDQHVVRDFLVRFDVTAAAHPIRVTLDLGLDTVGESVTAVTPPDTQSVAIDSVPGSASSSRRRSARPSAARSLVRVSAEPTNAAPV